MGKLIAAFALCCGLAFAQYTPPGGGGTGGVTGPTGPTGSTGAAGAAGATGATGPNVTSAIVQVGDPLAITPFMSKNQPSFLGFGGEFVGTGLNDLTLPDVFSSYSGSGPSVFLIKISVAGGTDSYQWAKGNSAFSSSVAITGASQTISEGLKVKFNATTGHTLGDMWVFPTGAGIIWPATLSEVGKDGATAALAGTGAGSVTNGVHIVKYSWATATGDTYLSNAGSPNVADNTVNGKISITGIPQSTSVVFIGTNIWISKSGGTTLYLAQFVPSGTTSYTFNVADSGLTHAAPAYLDNVTTAGGCLYGEVAGAGLGSCGIQFFDYGVRFPGTSYFFDQFADGVLGITSNFLTLLNKSGNGSSIATTGSPAFTGHPLVPTQSQGSANTDIASTAYVDTAVANGIAGVNPAVAVQVATAAVLPNSPAYLNGASGIGATLATATTNTALVVDGVTMALNDRVLVKNQASSFQNGVYFLSTAPSVGVAWALTRALDYDQQSDMNNTGAIPVINGTANASTQWVQSSKVTTVGTDAVTFAQFSYAPAALPTLAGTNAFAGANSFTGGSITVPTQSQADASTKAASTAYVDTGLGGKAASNAATTVNGTTCTLGSTCTVTTSALHSITITIDGGGSVISTGALGQFQTLAYGCTINRTDIAADQSGSFTLDIWKAAGAIPTSGNKISASAPITLSSAQLNQNGSISGWSATVTSGDVLGGTIVTASTVTKVTATIWCQ